MPHNDIVQQCTHLLVGLSSDSQTGSLVLNDETAEKNDEVVWSAAKKYIKCDDALGRKSILFLI